MTSSLKTWMLGAAFGVSAIFGGVALADDAAGITATGNIAISTDYMFRGITQTASHEAVSGGFDLTDGIFYAGTWASSIAFSPMELDLYGGLRPTTGPISWDIGAIGYLYPHPFFQNENYFEGYVKATVTPATGLTLGVSGFYSPEFFGKTGSAYYIEGNGSFAITKSISASGAVGYQDIADVDGPSVPGKLDGNYVTWNAGLTYTWGAFSFDARYIDTDIGKTDAITAFSGSLKNTNARGVFTIKKAL